METKVESWMVVVVEMDGGGSDGLQVEGRGSRVAGSGQVRVSGQDAGLRLRLWTLG